MAEESGLSRDYSGQTEDGVNYRDQELEKIVNRYKTIEGEWSIAQIEKFAEEITGFNSNYKHELKTSDEINYQAIKNMRTGEAVTGGQDIQEAASSLKSFIEAQKGDNEELRKWKREKFDN